MKSLDLVFTEQNITDLSVKVLNESIRKITEELDKNYIKAVEGFAYEHYENVKAKIEGELIKEICADFISNPKAYKYHELLKKLFEDNKEFLTSTLTEEAILKNVQSVFENHIDSAYIFCWRWKDAIVDIIKNNWHALRNDERINNGLLRQIDQLKNQNADLLIRVQELEQPQETED